MNKDRLKTVLASDEGYEKVVYLDSMLEPTCGIGHLIKEGDLEFGCVVGTKVSDDRINELFLRDIRVCLEDCSRVYSSDFETFPEDAQITIASLLFQLGSPRYGGFVNHISAVKARDWAEAAAQLRDSLLYRQTTARTERHAKRLEGLALG
jgi:lysozyme